MNIYIDLHFANDAHGVIAVNAQAVVTFSPREGFDAEKIGELERDLGPYISERLNDALKRNGKKTGDICNGGDCERHRLGAEPCADCQYCDAEGNI